MKDIPRCQHIRCNGRRCGSPALRGRPYCYYHYDSRQRLFGLTIPSLEDADAIQVALTQLARNLVEGGYDIKRASVLAYVLQTASSNLKHTRMADREIDEPACDEITPAVACEQVPPFQPPRDADHAAQIARYRAEKTNDYARRLILREKDPEHRAFLEGYFGIKAESLTPLAPSPDDTAIPPS